MLTFILWLLLLFFCWPLALLAVVAYPIIWFLLLPFRLIGITFNALFKLLESIITLPVKILSGPRTLR